MNKSLNRTVTWCDLLQHRISCLRNMQNHGGLRHYNGGLRHYNGVKSMPSTNWRVFLWFPTRIDLQQYEILLGFEDMCYTTYLARHVTSMTKLQRGLHSTEATRNNNMPDTPITTSGLKRRNFKNTGASWSSSIPPSLRPASRTLTSSTVLQYRINSKRAKYTLIVHSHQRHQSMIRLFADSVMRRIIQRLNVPPYRRKFGSS